MINANELRVGNWVSATENFKDFPTPLRVIGIGFASWNCMGNHELDDFGVTTNSDGDYNSSWPYEQIHPIPLTHDILEKCGFECTMVDKYMGEKFRKDNYIIIEDKEEDGWAFGVDTYDGYYADIKHLHQLQNLYFALTNQELNIQF